MSKQQGEKIDKDYANQMIGEYIKLKALTKIEVDNGKIASAVEMGDGNRRDKEISDLKAKVTKFNSNDYNAFIFAKDDIERFFLPQMDDDGKLVVANYLAVILGAHPNPEGDFEAGSLTVLAMGCNMKKDENGNEEYFPLKIEYCADEKPPRKMIVKLKDEKNNNELNGEIYMNLI